MSTTTITKTIFFRASREVVWAYLTDKDKLGEWYHPSEVNLTAGEVYALYKTDERDNKTTIITGRVLEMNRPSKLVTTFIVEPFRGRETTVTWVLETAEGGTRLTLTHEGIATAAGDTVIPLLTALDKGWDEHFADLRKSIDKLSGKN